MSIDASPERRKLFERVYTTHCCNGHSRSALEPMPNTRSPLAGHFVDPNIDIADGRIVRCGLSGSWLTREPRQSSTIP
jgi:hypothetical protein